MIVVASELVDAVIAAARAVDARVVGVTGGIAAGKSTVAAAVWQRLGWPVVSTDGFIRAEAGDRKGFADSYDAAALATFLDAIRDHGRAAAPRYSHLHYAVVGYDDIVSDRIVIDGLHLGHPGLGVGTHRPARPSRCAHRGPWRLVPRPLPGIAHSCQARVLLNLRLDPRLRRMVRFVR